MPHLSVERSCCCLPLTFYLLRTSSLPRFVGIGVLLLPPSIVRFPRIAFHRSIILVRGGDTILVLCSLDVEFALFCNYITGFVVGWAIYAVLLRRWMSFSPAHSHRFLIAPCIAVAGCNAVSLPLLDCYVFMLALLPTLASVVMR